MTYAERNNLYKETWLTSKPVIVIGVALAIIMTVAQVVLFIGGIL